MAKSKEPNQNYSYWLARAIGNKTPLAFYDCPHCDASVGTMLPPVGEVYNSFTSCPYCEKLYFKVVDNTTASPVVGIQTEPEVIGDWPGAADVQADSGGHRHHGDLHAVQ